MKADLRLSIKDYHRNKNLRILLHRTPFPSRQFLVLMNGSPWSKTGQSLSLTRLLTAIRNQTFSKGF
jgi:hypothetical protein